MYRESPKGLLKHIDFILWDLLSIFVAFVLAYFLRHGHLRMNELYRLTTPILFLIDFAVIVMTDAYHHVIRRNHMVEFYKTFLQAVLIFLLHTTYLFFVGEDIYSRITAVLTAVLYTIISYIIRCLWKIHIRNTNDTAGKNSLLIITSCSRLKEAIRIIRQKNYGSYNIKGILLLDHQEDVLESVYGIPIKERPESIVEEIGFHWVDEVLLMADEKNGLANEEIDDIVSMGITVHQALNLAGSSLNRNRSFQTVLGCQSVSISLNVMGVRQAMVKRALDIVGGLVGCLITGILCLIIGPIIYYKSHGPIFFSQIRIGKNGRRFKMYKFRSMYMDAEERKAALMDQNELDSDLMFKMEDDPRVIGGKKGIGDFIRRTSIDEFPQFFNVLKGDMSLVGTRPPTLKEWKNYDVHHRARMGTRPGITGLWQVSGRSSIKDFEEVVRLDTYYIEHWSILLDIKIILKTIVLLFSKKGAM